MAKISKRFSSTVAILSVLCLIWGICIAVISWVLDGKTPASVTEKDIDFSFSDKFYSIIPYWWGGLGFIVPGILGITAGVTRNVVVMVFFLIFDILCLITSLVMSILVGNVISFWGTVSQYLEGQNGYCIDSSRSSSYFFENRCICKSRYTDKEWAMYDATCEKLKGIESLLVALVVLGALATMMSLIALFVSCCSFCNKEQNYHGAVITQQPGYMAPPSMVVAHASNYQQAGPYQHLPQQYLPQQYPTQYYPPQQYLPQRTPLLQQVPPPSYTETREPQCPVGLNKARLITNEET